VCPSHPPTLVCVPLSSPNSDFVNQVNSVGLTAVHLAVWARRSGIMQVLLQHDADIGVRSGEQLQPDILLPCIAGSTPLHLAAARGSVEISRLLLKTYVSASGTRDRHHEGRPSHVSSGSAVHRNE